MPNIYNFTYENNYKYTMVETSNQQSVDKTDYTNPIYNENDNFKSKKILDINNILGITDNPLVNVDMSNQGIGSGAGYIEISNGTYTIDASLN